SREREVFRQRQRGIAEPARGLELGRDEVGAAGRLADVLLRRRTTLVAIGVEQAGGDLPATTRASFQARLSASATAALPPRAPNGETTCAASPAKITRPCTKRSIIRQVN